MTSDSTIHIATLLEMNANRVTTQSPTNTWRFRAANIPDMAFNMSNHYVWDGGSVVVDDATHRRASVQAKIDTVMAGFDAVDARLPGILNGKARA